MSTASLSAPAAADELATNSEPHAGVGAGAGATAAAAAAVGGGWSCSAASLRKYYDECADFYDNADEGEEDTYICVDRVTSALLAALHRLDGRAGAADHADAEADADAHAVDCGPSLPACAHAARAITDGTLDSPIPLPCIGALALLGEEEEEEGGEGGGWATLTRMTATGSPQASPPPLPAQSSTSAASPTESPRSTWSSSPSLRSPSASPLAHSLSLAVATRARRHSRPLRVLDLGVGTGLASRPLFAALSCPPLRVARRGGGGGGGGGGGDGPHGGVSCVSVPPGTALPEIWGVDLSPGMLRVSSALPFAHLIAADLNTRLSDPVLYPHSPLARPDAQGYFDLCVSVGTTEFVRDQDDFLAQLRAFLSPGGLLGATFPCTRSTTYPDMSCVSEAQLLRSVRDSGGMDVIEVQHYRGWSVNAEEHIEYIQVLAQKRR